MGVAIVPPAPLIPALPKSARVFCDAASVCLVLFHWIFVITRPPSGDIHIFSGDPTQYVVVVTVTLVAILSFVAGRDKLSPATLLLLAGFVALDVVFGTYGWMIGIRLFLDTIGCVAAAVLFGPRIGIFCAAAYYLIMGHGDPGLLLWAPLNIFAAFCAGKYRELGGMSNIFTSAVSGLIVGLVVAMLTAPMNIVIFGPILHPGEPPTIQFWNEFKYVTVGIFGDSGGSDPIDKCITFVAGYFLGIRLLYKRVYGTKPPEKVDIDG